MAIRSRVARRRCCAAVAAALAAVSLAACGGGDDATTPATAVGITELTVAGTTAEPIKVMPLGDSLTEGGDPARPTTSPQSYRGYLHTMLTEAGYSVDFVGSQQTPAIAGEDPDHEGHGGFTIGPDNSTLCTGCGPANIDAGLEDWLASATPDVVLLMIGVNDLLPEENAATGLVRDGVPLEAGEKLTALVGRIRDLAPDATVIVASYPPTSFLVDPALDSLPAFEQLTASAKALGDGSDPQVLYAPMFETFETSWTSEDVLSESGDNLHPSASGANRIAKVWFDVLTPVLDERKTG